MNLGRVSVRFMLFEELLGAANAAPVRAAHRRPQAVAAGRPPCWIIPELCRNEPHAGGRSRWHWDEDRDWGLRAARPGRGPGKPRTSSLFRVNHRYSAVTAGDPRSRRSAYMSARST